MCVDVTVCMRVLYNEEVRKDVCTGALNAPNTAAKTTGVRAAPIVMLMPPVSKHGAMETYRVRVRLPDPSVKTLMSRLVMRSRSIAQGMIKMLEGNTAATSYRITRKYITTSRLQLRRFSKQTI